MKKVLLLTLSLLLLTAGMAAAAEDWLTIGGDYRFRYDYLEGKVHDYTQLVPSSVNGVSPQGAPVPGYTAKNTAFMTNRFGLNLKADPMEDVVVKARLVMYKVWGHQTAEPGLGFFGDRNNIFGTNDGTIGHVPEDSTLRVDYAFATVNNVFDQPLWISVGRRPSTGGIPSNYRANAEKQGTSGIPSIMVDYAFDGFTIGYAPDIAKLPGAYAKFCGGKGFDSGFRGAPPTVDPQTGVKDTDFLGLNVVAYDTEKLHIEAQYQLGKNIFDRPSDAGVGKNLGDISWIGGVVTTKMGGLNLFASAAVSKTDPNGQLATYDLDQDGITDASAGLLNAPTTLNDSHTGNAFYVGGRYDIASTKTKIGAEYNQGSKYWVGMVPASDDIWTGKLGTRGSVYEVYIIQELKRKAISKKGKAFVKLGYQYYTFDYTGSNFWIGPPVKIKDLQATADVNQGNFFGAVENAKDLYLTFEVQF